MADDKIVERVALAIRSRSGINFSREVAARLANITIEAYEAAQWQPIETAPKDGTKIDIWAVHNEGGGKGVTGYRIPNARWAGCWVRKIEDGDYSGEDDEIEWSVETHVKPEKWHFWASEMDRCTKATHWRPLPAAPDQR